MSYQSLKPIRKIGPLFRPTFFDNAKDPCIVYDGIGWHIFGSGGSIKKEEWQILHATAPDIEGPWVEQKPVIILGMNGPHVAAPSVVYDSLDRLFHMAIQKDFMEPGGGIEYCVSADGNIFTWMHTLLEPLDNSEEAGLYDPHFSEIAGNKFMVYSAMPAVMTYDRPFTPQPDVYIVQSESGLWSGPWKRGKKILDHTEVDWHHNNREHPDYEWGIEGPQLVELPNGKVLLNATCFIEEGIRGTRQRVFFAISDSPGGPYKSLGPVLSQREVEWESGENGHATAWIMEEFLYLFYQARAQPTQDLTFKHWQYGIAVFDVKDVYTDNDGSEGDENAIL